MNNGRNQVTRNDKEHVHANKASAENGSSYLKSKRFSLFSVAIWRHKRLQGHQGIIDG